MLLRLTIRQVDRRLSTVPVMSHTLKHTWGQEEKGRADGGWPMRVNFLLLLFENFKQTQESTKNNSGKLCPSIWDC